MMRWFITFCVYNLDGTDRQISSPERRTATTNLPRP